MRILHIIRDLRPETGGPAFALLGLSEAQTRLGHEVTILATELGVELVTPSNVRQVRARAILKAWGWAPALKGILEKIVPQSDILHLHMIWDYPILAGAQAARRLKKPFFLRPCGQLDAWSLAQQAQKKRLYLSFFGQTLFGATAIHFTSEGERNKCGAALGNVPTVIIPNGVGDRCYTNLPSSTDFSKRFELLERRPFVLYLGRLHPKKQPEVLIQAFARISVEFTDHALVLVGPGEAAYISYLMGRAEKLGISQRCLFTGPLLGRAVIEAYRAAALFVLPSLQENFGMAIIEAMAAGCPVLISDSLDLAGEITKAGAGVACPPNVETLASHLRSILRNIEFRCELSQRGAKFAVEKYQWGPIAQATVSAYEKALSSRHLRVHS